jgi:hypothetical protein
MASFVVCATMGDDCVPLGRLSGAGTFEPVAIAFAHPHDTLAEARAAAAVSPLPTLIVEFGPHEQRCSGAVPERPCRGPQSHILL